MAGRTSCSWRPPETTSTSSPSNCRTSWFRPTDGRCSRSERSEAAAARCPNRARRSSGTSPATAGMIWSFSFTTASWFIHRNEGHPGGANSPGANAAGDYAVLFLQQRRGGGEHFVAQPVGGHASGVHREVEVFGDLVERRQQGEVEPLFETAAVLAGDFGPQRSH